MFAASFGLTVWVAASSAHADTGAKDVQVILKTIGFLSSKPSGPVTVDVLFDPANAASKKDAESIKALLDGAKGGNITPTAKLIGLDQLGGLDGQAAIVASDVSAAGQDAIANAVKGKKILTVSTDPACAKAGKCVLSVHSEPKVEILFNHTAAQAAGVEFMPTFRMMITEL